MARFWQLLNCQFNNEPTQLARGNKIMANTRIQICKVILITSILGMTAASTAQSYHYSQQLHNPSYLDGGYTHELYFNYSYGGSEKYNRGNFSYGYRFSKQYDYGSLYASTRKVNLTSVNFYSNGNSDLKLFEVPFVSYDYKYGLHSKLNANDNNQGADYTMIYVGLAVLGAVAIAATAEEEEDECDPEFPVLGPFCEFND